MIDIIKTNTKEYIIPKLDDYCEAESNYYEEYFYNKIKYLKTLKDQFILISVNRYEHNLDVTLNIYIIKEVFDLVKVDEDRINKFNVFFNSLISENIDLSKYEVYL